MTDDQNIVLQDPAAVGVDDTASAAVATQPVDQPVPDPAAIPDSASAPAKAQKSPLDILEEILKEADSQDAAKAGSTPSAAAPASPDPAVTPEQTAEADAAVQAQIAQQQEAQRQQDQIALQQQIEALKTISDTPQFQAAQEQHQEEQDVRDSEDVGRVGNEIRQLEHIKIPVDPSTS